MHPLSPNRRLYEVLLAEFESVASENRDTSRLWLVKEFVANVLECLSELLRDIS